MTLRRSHSHGIGNKESHGFGSKWRARVYSKIKAPDLDWVNWAALVEQ